VTGDGADAGTLGLNGMEWLPVASDWLLLKLMSEASILIKPVYKSKHERTVAPLYKSILLPSKSVPSWRTLAYALISKSKPG
jgi:hypothetical protein